MQDKHGNIPFLFDCWSSHSTIKSSQKIFGVKLFNFVQFSLSFYDMQMTIVRIG